MAIDDVLYTKGPLPIQRQPGNDAILSGNTGTGSGVQTVDGRDLVG